MKLRVVLGESDGAVNYWLWCPACDGLVHITNAWDFDGNVDAPTFSPSILVQSADADGPTVCHSWLRAGVWEFLGDSTHRLAGQRVPMVDLPDWATT